MAKKYLIKQIKALSDNDISYFVEKMRPADKREIESITTASIEEELKDSIESSSKCFVGIGEQQEPIVLYGVVESDYGGMIWCVGTNYFEEYKKPFVRESRRIIAGWLARYKRLYNAVAAFNTPAIRWLKSLGAEFSLSFNTEVNNEKFYFFEIKEREKNV